MRLSSCGIPNLCIKIGQATAYGTDPVVESKHSGGPLPNFGIIDDLLPELAARRRPCQGELVPADELDQTPERLGPVDIPVAPLDFQRTDWNLQRRRFHQIHFVVLVAPMGVVQAWAPMETLRKQRGLSSGVQNAPSCRPSFPVSHSAGRDFGRRRDANRRYRNWP